MIDIFINNEKYSFQRGMSLEEMFEASSINNDRIVAAIIDNQIYRLNYKPEESCKIKTLNRGEELGNRIYRRSLFMLLAKAVYEIYPEADLKIEHSLSNGVYCELLKNSPLTQHDLKKIKIKMNKFVEEDLPLFKEVKPKEELIDIYKQQGMKDKVELIRNCQDEKKFTSYCLDDYYDYFYYYMVPSTGYLDKFDLHYCMPGFILLFPHTKNSNQVPEFVDQPKLANVFLEYERLGDILEVGHVSDLNAIIENNEHEELVRISEALHERKIAKIADQIYEEIENRKIILIAGPTSSGKTTFTHRLATQLRVDGLEPVTISTDDYFVNRENTPLDEEGNYDFEALEAIDLDLFNDHLLKLIQGEKIEVPSFNFEEGVREMSGEYLQIEEDQPILVEGIHGLNEELTPIIPQNHKFKIYVSALTQLNLDQHNRIPTSDTRLLRRIIRDYKYRGHDLQTTIEWWPSVRRGEEKNIFPYQENADVMFNSALIYELAVLKKYLLPLLNRVNESNPVYHEARRLKEVLSYFTPMPDLSVPQTSILREFIGRSAFR